MLQLNRTKANALLLGVTGGIASGKTTVANLFADLGVAIIDFDIISRQVVEPGMPSFEEIVEFFGEEIVDRDGHLDRKILSGIVFQDERKRKRLEDILHPRIVDTFIGQANEITKKAPDAIIQAVIPLLFEVGLQDLVHKTLVVYISRERQIERLIKRDKITRDHAANIIKAQLPIAEKAGMADFVINNENSLDDTKSQVEELWKKLKQIQDNP
ncbi:MAG: dephospho-CoA kinase [Deltaproteobacteria bacterium]|nr:dephospho-CoA kinase [Deltaproteobacteria bacterium]MBW2116987.1 dephospho-CoA kinase [Deltaproteobacteria bacterium]MBW2343465.1 dephospho-CoA kinase [Deltaproteobacteria bacterium]